MYEHSRNPYQDERKSAFVSPSLCSALNKSESRFLRSTPEMHSRRCKKIYLFMSDIKKLNGENKDTRHAIGVVKHNVIASILIRSHHLVDGFLNMKCDKKYLVNFYINR